MRRGGGWAHTEVRFAGRKAHGCATCSGTIDQEPYVHTVCSDGWGGLTAWNLCRTCAPHAA